MRPALRPLALRFARLLLPATTLAALLSPGVPSPAAPGRSGGTPGVVATKGVQPVASLPPEVRLRKLHLVRPDLIPYPIAYEVYC